MTNNPMECAPPALEWKPSESETVETKSAHVPALGGNGSWEIESCPWWLDAQLREDQVQVRPKYFGRFRGKIRLRGALSALRVSIKLKAPESAVNQGRRHALRHALWTQLTLVVLGLFAMSGMPQASAAAPTLWLLVSSVAWGWMRKDRALMIRSMLAMVLSLVAACLFWRIALDHLPNGALPPLTWRSNGILGPLLKTFGVAKWPVLLLMHGGLTLSVWGGCVGGWRLAFAAGWRGAFLALICFGLVPLAGYLVAAATVLGTLIWLICWQRMLGALLMPVPPDPSFSRATTVPGVWRSAIILASLAIALFATMVGYHFYIRSPLALREQKTILANPSVVPVKAGGEEIIVRTFSLKSDTQPKRLGALVWVKEILFWSDGELVSLDTRTGAEQRWSPQRRWEFSAPTPGRDDYIYTFGGGGAYLHSFGIDGQRKWSALVGEACFGTIGDRDGNVYTAGEWTVYAFDAKGKRKWTYRSEERMAVGHLLTPASDGTLYLPGEKMLQAITPDGQRKWSIPIENGCYRALPAPDGGVYLGLFDRTIRLIDSSGHERSKIPTGQCHAFAAGADGVLCFKDAHGQLCATDPDGRVRWALNIGDLLMSEPVIGADGTVVVRSGPLPDFTVRMPPIYRPDTFRAISAQGKVEWSIPVSSNSSPPFISPDGVVYFRTADGKIIAVERKVKK